MISIILTREIFGRAEEVEIMADGPLLLARHSTDGHTTSLQNETASHGDSKAEAAEGWAQDYEADGWVRKVPPLDPDSPEGIRAEALRVEGDQEAERGLYARVLDLIAVGVQDAPGLAFAALYPRDVRHTS